MTNQKPTPQLRAALTEFLEQKINMPDFSMNPINGELDVEKWGDRPYAAHNIELPPELLEDAQKRLEEDQPLSVLCSFEPIGFNGNRPVLLENPLTLRQFLSAYPNHKWGDPFALEMSRSAKIDTPQYKKWLQDNPKVKDYIEFLTTVTNIVDYDRLPKDITAAQVPAILRNGLQIFRQEAADYREMLKLIMSGITAYDQDREMVKSIVEGMLTLNITPHQIPPEKFEELQEHISAVSASFASRDELISHITDYILENNIIDIAKERENSQQAHQHVGEDCEDFASFYGNICSHMSTAYEKAGIASRSQGDSGPSH